MAPASSEPDSPRSGPSPQDSRHPRPPQRRGGRLGLGFFAVYVLLYGGFIVLVLFCPGWLAARPFGGVNLAITYGMGLIAAAVLLALGFMVASRSVESRDR
jgi:uncharacterized membrane protein (DUF485 family)